MIGSNEIERGKMEEERNWSINEEKERERERERRGRGGEIDR